MWNNRVSTISDGSMGIAAGRSLTARVTIGTPQATGKLAWVRSTYASQYNHAVTCFESFDNTTGKKRMRGGRLLLYRLLIFAVVVVSFVLGILSSNVKAYVAFPVVSAVVYLDLTIWNWHIFRINGNLLHSHMIKVSDNVLPGYINRFFTIPIYTHITDHQILAISNYAQTAIAQLIEQHRGSDSIKIMCYTNSYQKYMKFPIETLLYFIVFIGIFIVAITSVVKQST
ncbi:unnamed protein product [Adineta ricciae]|uniref:Uncharacterized protein n=1 Tax=Adineta ricciae TaxID=249248 RepID=A0A814ZPY1_ADIRI|nr:unnamed protein product [Adineta ricciae]CAF1327767.1 unnamed protein product [Adineta ricciae]